MKEEYLIHEKKMPAEAGSQGEGSDSGDPEGDKPGGDLPKEKEEEDA